MNNMKVAFVKAPVGAKVVFNNVAAPHLVGTEGTVEKWITGQRLVRLSPTCAIWAFIYEIDEVSSMKCQ